MFTKKESCNTLLRIGSCGTFANTSGSGGPQLWRLRSSEGVWRGAGCTGVGGLPGPVEKGKARGLAGPAKRSCAAGARTLVGVAARARVTKGKVWTVNMRTIKIPQGAAHQEPQQCRPPRPPRCGPRAPEHADDQGPPKGRTTRSPTGDHHGPQKCGPPGAPT